MDHLDVLSFNVQNLVTMARIHSCLPTTGNIVDQGAQMLSCEITQSINSKAVIPRKVWRQGSATDGELGLRTPNSLLILK
jgi:hypothetical protein